MAGWKSEALIVDAVRSPIGKRNGSLASIRGDELCAQVLNGLVARHDLDPAEVEDVQMGCVTQIGEQGWNIGRMVPLAAGWPETVCGTSVDRQCASSMQANFNAAAAVWSGQLDLVVSGGVRSFAATIEPTDPSDDLLHVRLIPSGKMRTVHIAFGEFYAIGRAGGASTGKGRRLYRMSVADLQRGDTVLILGVDQGDGSLHACALIAGFSPFAVLPPDPSQQMRWIFDNAALGDSFPREP